MVLKVVKLVALATVLPRNLVFLVSQPLFERLHSTTASHVIAVVEGDPCSVQAPQGASGNFSELEPPRTSARCYPF
jgi:hypothetical protein